MPELEPEHTRDELKDLQFGPYEVNFVDSFVLELTDGHKISMNVWFPGNSKDYFSKQEATVRYCNALDDEGFIGEVKIIYG